MCIPPHHEVPVSAPHTPPPRRWRKVTKTALATMMVLGAPVNVHAETVTGQAGATVTSMPLVCDRDGGNLVRSVVVDVMNRRLIPMTGKKGSGCVAAVPFQWPAGGMPDLVDPAGKAFRSDYTGIDLLFAQGTARKMLELFGPTSGTTSADSARLVKGDIRPADVWEVVERDPERGGASRLSKPEAKQFLARMQFLHETLGSANRQNNAGGPSIVDDVLRNTKSQVNSRVYWATRDAVNQGINKVLGP